jgi:imidazole glycerol-phosphate synthase subunit HisF
LAIEIDGDIHLGKDIAEYDEGRTSDLEKPGIRIIRFTNDQIYNNVTSVTQEISHTISLMNPPLGGRGGNMGSNRGAGR